MTTNIDIDGVYTIQCMHAWKSFEDVCQNGVIRANMKIANEKTKKM